MPKKSKKSKKVRPSSGDDEGGFGFSTPSEAGAAGQDGDDFGAEMCMHIGFEGGCERKCVKKSDFCKKHTCPWKGCANGKEASQQDCGGKHTGPPPQPKKKKKKKTEASDMDKFFASQYTGSKKEKKGSKKEKKGNSLAPAEQEFGASEMDNFFASQTKGSKKEKQGSAKKKKKASHAPPVVEDGSDDDFNPMCSFGGGDEENMDGAYDPFAGVDPFSNGNSLAPAGQAKKKGKKGKKKGRTAERKKTAFQFDDVS